MDEIEVMRRTDELLSGLDEQAQSRVVSWLASKFLGPLPRPTQASQAEYSNHYSEFAELLADSGATTESERTLVAAYWLQAVEGEESFGSQTVNSLLKDAGYGVSNITRSFDSLRELQPTPIVQLKKSGTSKQARKLYKLSSHGIKSVQKMVKSNA